MGFILRYVDCEERTEIPQEMRDELKKAEGRWSHEGGGYTYTVGMAPKLQEGLSKFDNIEIEDLTRNHSTSVFGASGYDGDARDAYTRLNGYSHSQSHSPHTSRKKSKRTSHKRKRGSSLGWPSDESDS